MISALSVFYDETSFSLVDTEVATSVRKYFRDRYLTKIVWSKI